MHPARFGNPVTEDLQRATDGRENSDMLGPYG